MGYSVNLMSKVVPKLQFTSRSKYIPNYEGRVMCIIIFILKLFFGLDDVTEDKFSIFAENINYNPCISKKKMFVWDAWMHFIYYRKLVLMQHHFPTKYLYDDDNVENSELFTEFLTEVISEKANERPLTIEALVIKQLLEKLKERQKPSSQGLLFLPSLTPFQDYIKVVLNSTVHADNNYLTKILTLNFKDDTLEFLAKPFSYLEEINKTRKVGIKHRGANDNIELIKINNIKVNRENWRKSAKKDILVKLGNASSLNKTDSKLNTTKLEQNIVHLNTKDILKNFTKRNLHYNRRSINKLLRTHKKKKRSQNVGCTQSSETLMTKTAESQTWLFFGSSILKPQESETERGHRSYIHYNPHTRFWLKSFDASEVGSEEFTEIFKTLPESFRFILNECARITEQSSKDLYQEFADTEIYLCYVAELTAVDKVREKICEKNLERLIRKSKKNW